MIFRRFSALLPIAAALLAAALALAACGRKGSLDAPPSASVADQAAVDEPGMAVRDAGATGLPMIKGPNKRIPLDVLID
ncbi:MAG: lipoprotein [Pseudorhodoplanes sp.]